MQNVGTAVRSLQRVVHKLGGYVRARAYGCRQSQKTAGCAAFAALLVSYMPLANDTHQSNEGRVSCKSRPLREGSRKNLV